MNDIAPDGWYDVPFTRNFSANQKDKWSTENETQRGYPWKKIMPARIPDQEFCIPGHCQIPLYYTISIVPRWKMGDSIPRQKFHSSPGHLAGMYTLRLISRRKPISAVIVAFSVKCNRLLYVLRIIQIFLSPVVISIHGKMEQQAFNASRIVTAWVQLLL